MQPTATTGLITNEPVLDEDVPPARENIVGRDEEFETIKVALDPIARGEQIESLRVFGPPGAGKSHCVEVMLQHLHDADNGIDGFDWTIVSCYEDDTRTKILAHAVAAVTGGDPRSLRNTKPDQLRDRLRSNISRPLMLVCDEVDILDSDAMRALRDILRTPDCAITVIANDEEQFFENVTPSLESRLKGAYQAEFDAYNVADVAEILRVRAEYGLADGVVSPRDREAIAESMAPNARNAIVALRKGVKAAASDGRQSVSLADVERAIPNARQYIRRKQYDQLRASQQTLVDVIREADRWVDCSTVKAEYHDRVDEDVTGRQRRRTLGKLENYGFIESSGATKDAEYRYIELE
jgi:Cdc6-like AAA superfamily ATPase